MKKRVNVPLLTLTKYTSSKIFKRELLNRFNNINTKVLSAQEIIDDLP